jgi:hypothetical protein
MTLYGILVVTACRNAVNAQQVDRAEERINKSAADTDSDSEVTSMTPMKTRESVVACVNL